MKEWAYAGFGITLLSAIVAHYSSGDALIRSLEPLFFFFMLAISNQYLCAGGKTAVSMKNLARFAGRYAKKESQ